MLNLQEPQNGVSDQEEDEVDQNESRDIDEDEVMSEDDDDVPVKKGKKRKVILC